MGSGSEGSALLYLNSYGRDFEGGEFAFIDDDADRLVDPREVGRPIAGEGWREAAAGACEQRVCTKLFNACGCGSLERPRAWAVET